MPGALYKKLRRQTTNQLYFPEIDGIRFFAISLVVLFHIRGYVSEKSGNALHVESFNIWDIIAGSGYKGVELFFVLSGFILCLPFAHQYLNKGKKVSLKKYYLRRVTRLEPPYFIATISVFLLLLITKVNTFSVLFPSLLASLAYAHQLIFHTRSLILPVSWSLEVEIQFYLLAPFLFRSLLISKNIRRVLLVSSIIGFAVLQQFVTSSIASLYTFIHYFLAGILLADLYVSGNGVSVLNRKGIAWLALIIFVTIVVLPHHHIFLWRAATPFLALALYIIVLRNDIVKRLFSYKFIPTIGGMCYTIYLLHWPIISMVGRFTLRYRVGNSYQLNVLIQAAIYSTIILIICSVFYYFIERPFMSTKWLNKIMGKDKKHEEMNQVSA